MANATDASFIREFSRKYADIMIGIVLVLGFQWWFNLRQAWQFIAFIFVYLNLVDYWIDSSRLFRKFPLQRKTDVILYTFIIFSMFFMIYATQRSILTLLFAFALYRAGDLAFLNGVKREHRSGSREASFIESWIRYETVETMGAGLLLFIGLLTSVAPALLFVFFIILRAITRTIASLTYNTAYYTP